MMVASNDVGVTLSHELKVFDTWLKDPEVNEIAINNDPSTVFVWRKGEWEEHEVNVPFPLERIAMVAGNYTKNDITEQSPIISGELPCGSRIEITTSPACEEGCIFINIRKHKVNTMTLTEFEEQGYFTKTKHCINLSLNEDQREKIMPLLSSVDKELYQLATKGLWIEFLKKSQRAKGLNGVISGSMGTGKTTFLQALINLVDEKDRIITVEDSNEIQLKKHRNYQKLFFKRKKPGDIKKIGASATEVLMSALRKTPDRVYLGELRGEEALNFVEDVSNIGLKGSMTTVHSSSSLLTFTRIASLIKRSEGGKTLNFREIYDLIFPVVNYVIFLEFDDGKRKCTEIYFDPVYALHTQGLC